MESSKEMEEESKDPEVVEWHSLWRMLEHRDEMSFAQLDRGYDSSRAASGIRRKSLPVVTGGTIGRRKSSLRRSLVKNASQVIMRQRSLIGAEFYNDIEVKDPTYNGPHLPTPLDLESVVGMITHFRMLAGLDSALEDTMSSVKSSGYNRRFSSIIHRVPLHSKYMQKLARQAARIFTMQENVVKLQIPENGRVTVVGDLHGQLRDLLLILERWEFPSATNYYIFNGDFVDRGDNSGEVIAILYALKILYPKFVHLNRGNHEARDVNCRDGFQMECLRKWDMDVFDEFQESFATLPLAHLINEQVLVLHGGLAWDEFSLESLEDVHRFVDIPEPGSLMEDILWSDPMGQIRGRVFSDRGVGCRFGKDVCEDFLEQENLKMMIRSHECIEQGHEALFDGLCHTIFSASNYCGVMENQGAVMIFSHESFPAYQIESYYSDSRSLLNGRIEYIHDADSDAVRRDVIGRLLEVIMMNRLDLKKYFDNKGEPSISMQQWENGMREVCKVDIPWKAISIHLPGFERCIDNDMVAYESFLELNNPLKKIESRIQEEETMFKDLVGLPGEDDESSVDEEQENQFVTPDIYDEADLEDGLSDDKMTELNVAMTLLYQNRLRMEITMRIVDELDEGALLLEEFLESVKAAMDFQCEIKDEVMESLLERLDCIEEEADEDGNPLVYALYTDFFVALDEAVNYGMSLE